MYIKLTRERLHMLQSENCKMIKASAVIFSTTAIQNFERLFEVKNLLSFINWTSKGLFYFDFFIILIDSLSRT